MTVHWPTSDVPGRRWNPEPDDGDGPPYSQPTWRDDPDGLDRLCDEGARQLHGPIFEIRDIHTVTVTGELL